jgi:hypothetical protein
MVAWILPLLTLAAAPPSWTDKPVECARLCGTRALLKTRTRVGTQNWLDLQSGQQLAPPASEDILRIDARLVFDGTTYRGAKPAK